VRATHAGAGVGLLSFGDGHGGNLSEILASKGLGESISLFAPPTERQGREKFDTSVLKMCSAWQFVAVLKII
jgi:hypothetical protein